MYINGGKFNSVCGMGSITTGAGNKSISVDGTIYLHLNGGEIRIVCPAMRHANSNTVTGDGSESCQDSYVILSRNHNHFDTEFRACVLHDDDAFRQSNLIFDNYTGALVSCEIIGFENIEIQKNSNVNIVSGYLYNNSDWILDIRRRSKTYGNIPAFTLANNNEFFPKFKLKINAHNKLVPFTLLECNNMNLTGQFDNTNSIDIVYNDQQIWSVDVSNLNGINNIIHNTNTKWDGYGIIYIKDQIIFCNPEKYVLNLTDNQIDVQFDQQIGSRSYYTSN